MFHTVVNEFREILRLVVGEAGGKMLRDLLRGEAKEGAGVIAERVRTLIQKNPRADLLFVLLSLEPEERENLMAAHKQALAEGNENQFVLALGEALPRTAEGKVDEERAKQILRELNKLSPVELAQALEFLKHDPIAQWIRYWILGQGREAIISALEIGAFVVGVAWQKVPERNQVVQTLQRADQKTATQLNRFADWLEGRR